MSVNAVSGQNYGYNIPLNLADKKAVEDAFLQLPDEVLYKMADAQAKKQINEKGYRARVALCAIALPFAYGLKAVGASKGRALNEVFTADGVSLVNKFFNTVGKDLKGPAAKFAIGKAVTLRTVGAILGGLGLISAVRGLFHCTQKTKEFSENHSGLVFLTELAALFAGMSYAPKLFGKLFDKIPAAKLDKWNAKINDWGTKFNSKKMVQSLQGKFSNILAKSPAWLKKAGKFTFAAAPMILLLGLLADMFRQSAKHTRAFENNMNIIMDEKTRIVTERENAQAQA